jgi:hypothetical protein
MHKLSNFDYTCIDGIDAYYDRDIGEDHQRHGVRYGEIRWLVGLEVQGVLYEDAAEWNAEMSEELGEWEAIEDRLN